MPYGTLAADIVQSSTAGTAPQFNDGNGTQTGTLCRAWVNFNGNSGASPVIRASFNVSSVTRTATGAYTLAFTTNMSDINYSVVINGSGESNAGRFCPFTSTVPAVTAPTVSSFICITANGTVAYADCTYVNVAVFR